MSGRISARPSHFLLAKFWFLVVFFLVFPTFQHWYLSCSSVPLYLPLNIPLVCVRVRVCVSSSLARESHRPSKHFFIFFGKGENKQTTEATCVLGLVEVRLHRLFHALDDLLGVLGAVDGAASHDDVCPGRRGLLDGVWAQPAINLNVQLGVVAPQILDLFHDTQRDALKVL